MTINVKITKKEYDFYHQAFKDFNDDDVEQVMLNTYYRELKSVADRYYYMYGRLCYLKYFQFKEINLVDYNEFKEIVNDFQEELNEIEQEEYNFLEIDDETRIQIHRELDSFPIFDYKDVIKEGIIDGYYFDNLDKLTHNNKYFDRIKYDLFEISGKEAFEFSEFCVEIEEEINNNYIDSFDFELYDDEVENMLVKLLCASPTFLTDMEQEEAIQELLTYVHSELAYQNNKDLLTTINSYLDNENIPEAMKNETAIELIEYVYASHEELQIPKLERVLS